jgi:hypothetical protein
MAGTEEIASLKTKFLSTDPQEVKEAVHGLKDMEQSDLFSFLIDVLQLDNTYCSARNEAALRLMDMGNADAIDPLFNAALKKENINYNGTLVYAAGKFSCTHKMKELFQILFYHGYEAQLGAYNILMDQEFDFANEDVIEIEKQWEDLQTHPDKAVNFEDAKEMIQDAVERISPIIKTK